MVRKTASKRKGIQRGVQRGKVTKKAGRFRKPSTEWFLALERRVERLVLLLYGEVMRICIKFHLVPIMTTPEGLYEVKSKNGVRSYQFYKVLTGLIMLYRDVVAVKICTNGELTSEKMLTVIGSLSFTNSWLVSVYDASETVILLNNFNMILSYLECQRGQEFRMFSDLRVSLKAMSTIVMLILCILCFAMVNGLLFGGLPTSWLRLAEAFIDMSFMGRIWWQLLFLPLEVLTVFPLLFTACIVCVSTFISLHILKLFGEEIRRMRMVDLASWEKVERMYLRWQLCAQISRPWLVAHTASIIVTVSCAATLYIFMAIKYTSLPILVYSIVAVMGPGFLFLLAVGMYDAVMVSQLSGGVLSDQLMTFTSPRLANMQVKCRRELLKRVKGMRPISIPIGSFADVQYIAMAAIWEEIVNQVVFLLSM